MTRALLLPLALLSLGACALDLDGRGDGGGTRLAGEIVNYRCDDDKSFTASFDRDLEHAAVGAGGDTHRLTLQQRNGDRLRYAGSDNGDDIRLDVDGNDATLRLQGDKDLTDCSARS